MTRELERLNSVMEGPHLSVHAFAEFSTVEQCSRMEFGSCRLLQLCSEETRPNFGFGSSEKDRCACALHFHMVAELRAPGLWVQHTSEPWHSQGNHPCLFLNLRMCSKALK